jgi:uncharacterized damage-inducible protein DinB
MTKEEMLARLAESRQALHQAIEGLSEEEMTQVQVEGVWTIKDVLGHIASSNLHPPFSTANADDGAREAQPERK